jgi:hypothetical protein
MQQAPPRSRPSRGFLMICSTDISMSNCPVTVRPRSRADRNRRQGKRAGRWSGPRFVSRDSACTGLPGHREGDVPALGGRPCRLVRARISFLGAHDTDRSLEVLGDRRFSVLPYESVLHHRPDDFDRLRAAVRDHLGPSHMVEYHVERGRADEQDLVAELSRHFDDVVIFSHSSTQSRLWQSAKKLGLVNTFSVRAIGHNPSRR